MTVVKWIKADIAGEEFLPKHSKERKRELALREIERMKRNGFGLRTWNGMYHFSNPPRSMYV